MVKKKVRNKEGHRRKMHQWWVNGSTKYSFKNLRLVTEQFPSLFLQNICHLIPPNPKILYSRKHMKKIITKYGFERSKNEIFTINTKIMKSPFIIRISTLIFSLIPDDKQKTHSKQNQKAYLSILTIFNSRRFFYARDCREH